MAMELTSICDQQLQEEMEGPNSSSFFELYKQDEIFFFFLIIEKMRYKEMKMSFLFNFWSTCNNIECHMDTYPIYAL